MDDKETGNELSGLAAALIFIGLGVFLFIISMLFSSGAFGENTMLYKVQNAIASVIGGGLIFTGDVTLALSIMLIFQGFSLFTHKGISVILYSLWLFVPFFLVVRNRVASRKASSNPCDNLPAHNDSNQGCNDAPSGAQKGSR